MQLRHANVARVALLACILAAICTPGRAAESVEQILQSQTDLWGEAALREPGGPSYAYFEKLLPPLRYVDASFKHYPIVLSAPSNPTKARLLSNGSAVNALGRSRSWIGETGRPVTFYVGDTRDVFGSDLSNLTGPKYADGYLPIVQLEYTSAGATYAQEAFASVDPQLADYGVVLVKFTLKKASGRNYTPTEGKDKDPATTQPVPGVEAAENLLVATKEFDEKVEAIIEGPEQLALKANRLFPVDGKVMWGLVHPRWIVNPGRGAVIAPLKTGESAYLAIFTKAADPAKVQLQLTPETYQAQRDACAAMWNQRLARGATIETPEAVVNNAARASIIGNFLLINGDQMHYSAGNQYAKRYIGEGSDAVRCLALWGYGDDAARLSPAQFQYTRAGLEFHQAAFKLQMLAHYFRLTRDEKFVRSIRPMWQKEIEVILKGRETENGMFPREKYCGDIDTRVYSLNSNANCWRALRDMSLVLADLGETDAAQKLATTAAEYRKILLDALDKAIRRDVDPPFVPIALSGEENPHDPIWTTTIGSYWNLMIEYVLTSGLFTADSQTATDILRYLQNKGGLCMGIVRARATAGNFWVYGGRLNDLYGMRYALTLLQRDEADRALISFYGKLAQGMTRDTFIGCEGSSIGAVDRFGRQMFLPPNSTANANFLQQLRYLLVQDYDLDDDGRAETLRLGFATPRAWLADGKRIAVKKAPTEFGEVSFKISSALRDGHVDATVDLPARNPPSKVLLRMRLPNGKKIASAKAGEAQLTVANGETIDLSGQKGHVTVTARVAP